MDGLNQSLGLYVIEAEKIIVTENRTKGRDKERSECPSEEPWRTTAEDP